MLSLTGQPYDTLEEVIGIRGGGKGSLKDFEIEYKVDPVRQAIADSWPNSLDDTAAQEQWGWKAEYDMHRMTDEMLKNLKKRVSLPQEQKSR